MNISKCEKFSGTAYHKKTAQNPRDSIDSYCRWDAEPAWEWEARIIIDEFDSSLDAYEDPFAIEEVVMGDILAVP